MSDVLSAVKLDFSSFYKFVSSVGLLLITAALALPWFVLKTSVPDTPPGSAAAMVVDEALGVRAGHYMFIVNAYPWISGSLFLLGLVLTAYGLIAWRNRQKEQDKDEDEAYRQRRELGRTEKASEEDRVEKLDQEAKYDQSAELETPVENSADDRNTAGGSGRSDVTSREDRLSRYNERRELLDQAEKRVAALLTSSFRETHRIETGVRMSDPGSPILDIVARSTVPDRWTSFAVEIRLVNRSINLAAVLRQMMMAVAIAARDVPEGQIQVQKVGRPPVAKSVSICIVVVPEEEHSGSSIPRPNLEVFRNHAARIVGLINSVLLRKVGVIVVSHPELVESAENWMRESVLEVMQNPETAIIRA